MNLVHRSTAAIAAGASVVPLLGEQIQITPFSGFLEVGVGGGAGLTYDLTIDGQAVATGVPAQTLTAFPTLPGQLDIQDDKVWYGKNITLRINNPTGGALTHFTYVRLSDEKRGT